MNKSILTVMIALTMLLTNSTISFAKGKTKTSIYSGTSISIKLKNDTDNEMSVINAGSGGTYRLSKNTVVTIKMDEGDKLFREKIVWLTLFEAARLSIKHKTAIVFQ